MKATLGDVISSFPLEKLTMAEGQRVLIGVLSTKIRIAKMHYKKGMGYFHCFDAECCDICGLPGVRYVFPIVHYNTDLLGELIKKESDLTIKDLALNRMLVVGKADYEGIITKQRLQEKQDSNITQIDLLVTCTKQEYQNRDYDVAGPAAWRKVLSKDQYKSALQFFHKNAELSLGKTFKSVTEFMQALEQSDAEKPVTDRPSAADPSNTKKLPPPKVEEDIDFDDLFDSDDVPF